MRGEAAAAGAAQLHRVEAEADAPVRQMLAEVGVVRRAGAPGASRHCRCAESSSSGSEQVARSVLVDRQAAARRRARARRASAAVAASSVADRGGIGLDVLAAAARRCRPLRPAGLAARGAAHERQELLVDEQRAARRAARRQRLSMCARRTGRRTRRQRDGHPAADDVVIEHEARVEHAAQQDFAHRLGVVELRRRPAVSNSRPRHCAACASRAPSRSTDASRRRCAGQTAGGRPACASFASSTWR